MSSAICTTLARMTRCLSAVVLKSVSVFARRPVTCFTNNTTTHVSQLARLSSCWKWFFLAASIQSGEHLSQHKAHHRDTQHATNSTLTTEKPQNNIISHPIWHPTTSEEHSGRPIQTHTNVVTSSLHSSVNLGCCWPRHCLLSHHKPTNAHAFPLWRSKSTCVASPWWPSKGNLLCKSAGCWTCFCAFPENSCAK